MVLCAFLLFSSRGIVQYSTLQCSTTFLEAEDLTMLHRKGDYLVCLVYVFKFSIALCIRPYTSLYSRRNNRAIHQWSFIEDEDFSAVGTFVFCGALWHSVLGTQKSTRIVFTAYSILQCSTSICLSRSSGLRRCQCFLVALVYTVLQSTVPCSFAVRELWSTATH